MKTRTLLGLALLSAVPLAAQAQTAPVPAKPVTLRFKFTPGQVAYYTLTVDTDGTMTNPLTQAPMALNNHLQALLRQTVKDVRSSDGAATVETGVDTASFSVNGQDFPIPPEKMAAMKTVGTTVMLPTGKILSFTPSGGGGGGAIPGMDFGRVNALSILGVLPDAPLKVGDSWKSGVSAGLTGSSVLSRFSLSGVDTAGGKTVAVITQTTDGSLDPATPNGAAPTGMGIGGKVKGVGTIRFNADAGTLESMTSAADMNLTMTPPGATAGMTIRMKITTSMKQTDAPAPAGAAKAP